MTEKMMQTRITFLKECVEDAKQAIENYDNLTISELELEIQDLEACLAAGLTEESLDI